MTRWTGRCASRGLAVLSLGIVLVIGAIGGALLIGTRGTDTPAWLGWGLVAVAIVVGVVGYLLSSLVVRVEDDRVVVAYGPFGWPRRVIGLGEIREVSAGPIVPRSATPASVPRSEPRPPLTEAPPTTTAAMTLSSNPIPAPV